MTTTYGPSALRRRSTKADLASLDDALLELIAQAGPPVTARQVYYMAAGRQLVSKDDRGYRQILRRLSSLREIERLPWDWIADNTRWVRRRRSYANLDEAITEWQATYRRDYWLDQPRRLELWVESDSIASFIHDSIYRLGVPLYVCRGQASRTYIRAAVDDARQDGKPVDILYVGDFDPSGLAIDRSLIDRYSEFGQDVDVQLARIALTADQILEHQLEGNPAKRGDPNFARFEETCQALGIAPLAYETEALPAAELRSIVANAVWDHVDLELWHAIHKYEDVERAQLAALLDRTIA
jgi:hypothetical protein